ncbi:hypothetical protein EJ07DRAFT_109848 [Lizonia empirigonia]|nr:hypothetical protein EJ07DRAFT_109848 [Lizonia empirigonia]
MFKPLSTAYSKALTTHLHNGQGLSSIKKSDFFPLFWKAWIATFTPELILRSFVATGISPLRAHPNINFSRSAKANVILRRFKKDTPESSHSDDSSTSVYSGDDWLKIDTLVRGITKDEGSRDTKKIRRSLHHLTIKNSLLHHENSGLKEVLKTQKKHKKKKEHRKLMVKEQKHVQKLEREKLRRSMLRERERERGETRDAEKAIQLSQKGKRKASQGHIQPTRRQERDRDDVGGDRAAEVPSAPPPVTTRRGRNVTLPSKYK